MTRPNILGTVLLFLLGQVVVGALMGSCQSCEYLGKRQTASDTMNLSSIFLVMSPTAIITGHNTDSRIEQIIKTISMQRKSYILDVDAFTSMITSHISSGMFHDSLAYVKENLKFLVFSDIGTIRLLLQKAQQLDKELGAGFLLRHFSRWLVVLTTGELNTLIIDDILLDNVAVTTIDNMSGNLCKDISLLQTIMWKNTSRQLQSVSQTAIGDLSTRLFPNTKTGLNGRLLKAAILPWISCKVIKDATTSSGPCNELISHLSEVYNFSFTYVEPEDQSWGKHDNGTWDGIMGLLVNKTVDISAVPYAWNIVRSHYVTFLYPFRYTYIDILYKKRESHVDWTILPSSFKWQVYLCGLAVLLGVIIFFLMSKRISVNQNGCNKLDSRQTLETILSTVGVTCNQGSSTLPKAESYRILLAFWWLTCIPVTAVFSGNLVAFLTVSKDVVPFSGLEDLLDSGYDIGVETGSYVTEILSRSNDSVIKQIWNKNRKYQRENLTNDADRMYHRTRLAEGRYAFITDSVAINNYMMETCNMAHTNRRMFPAMSSLIVPKESPLALLMDPELMSLVQRGLIDKWYEQPNHGNRVCLTQKEENDGLGLRHFFAVLVAAGCGVGVAAVVLVFEICKYKALSCKKLAEEGK